MILGEPTSTALASNVRLTNANFFTKLRLSTLWELLLLDLRLTTLCTMLSNCGSCSFCGHVCYSRHKRAKLKGSQMVYTSRVYESCTVEEKVECKNASDNNHQDAQSEIPDSSYVYLSNFSYTHVDLSSPYITLSQTSNIAVCNRGTN